MKSTCIIKLGAIGLLAYYFFKNKSSSTSTTSPSPAYPKGEEIVSTDLSCSDGTCSISNVKTIYTRNKVKVPYTV